MDIRNWIALVKEIIALAVLLFRWTNAKINRGSEVMKILGGLKSDVKNIKETVKENQENTKETLGKLEARLDKIDAEKAQELKDKVKTLKKEKNTNLSYDDLKKHEMKNYSNFAKYIEENTIAIPEPLPPPRICLVNEGGYVNLKERERIWGNDGGGYSIDEYARSIAAQYITMHDDEQYPCCEAYFEEKAYKEAEEEYAVAQERMYAGFD